MRTLALSAIFVVAGCTGGAVAPATLTAPIAPATPVGPPLATSPAHSPPSVAGSPPGAPAGGDVEVLGPSSNASGARMFTLGDVATVENVSTLTVRQAERGDALVPLPPAEGQTAYTFLVVFAWDGTTPGPISLGSSYYNAINFSLRDDEGFEYPVIQGAEFARQPELLFGDLAAGQHVQGWVTFYAPEGAEFVELTYRPIADDPVFFRVEPHN